MKRDSAAAPWSPARRRTAALALATAVLTAIGGGTLSQATGHLYGAVGYVIIAAAALFSPGWITVQVIGGQLLVASILLAPAPPTPLLVLPLVAGIIVTAELLAMVARLDTAPERESGPDLARVAVAGTVGAVVFAAVLLLGTLPGPRGLAAVALASAACLLLGLLLARRPPAP